MMPDGLTSVLVMGVYEQNVEGTKKPIFED